MHGLTDIREEQDYNYLEKEDYIPEEIEVTVTITIDKTFTIPTDSLEVEDYGENKVIFTEKSLEDAVRTYIVTPDQAYQYVPNRTSKEKAIQEDLEDWNVAEFVVIQE